MITNSNRRAYSAIAIAILLSAVFAPRPDNAGIWLRSLFEWLHVPVFGLISLAMLLLTPISWPSWQRFGLAFLGSILLGVFTEAAQIPTQRDASWEDIISDAAGAASFLVCAYAVGRKHTVVIISAMSATAIFLWSALPLIATTQAIIYRNSQFPVIFNGDIDSEKTFVSGINLRMETRKSETNDELYTQVQLIHGEGSRIEIRDLVSDWSLYAYLSLKIEVAGDQDLPITVRVHDKLHRKGAQPHHDRFNRRLTLSPGMNVVRIPLQNIRSAPRGRMMDMTKIDALIMFSEKSNATHCLNLYEISLS